MAAFRSLQISAPRLERSFPNRAEKKTLGPSGLWWSRRERITERSQLNRLDPHGRRIAYLQCPGCGVIVSAQNRPVGDRGWCSPGCRKRMRPAEPISETLAAMDDMDES